MRDAARARYQWDAAKIARVKAMLLAGHTAREIERAENVYRGTLVKFCEEHGLPRPQRPNYSDASARVLFEHYARNPDLDDVLRRYREARGFGASYESMRHHAAKLGVRRPASVVSQRTTVNRAEMTRLYDEARKALAPTLQALLDEGVALSVAAKRLNVSPKRAARMVRDGLLTRPVKPPKAPKPPKVAKPRKPPAPRKPSQRRASWVRVEAPPKPRPTYQSVEEWLAAGNAITRCPTVAVLPTSAVIPEDDRAAMTAVYAARDAAIPKGPRGVALKAISWAKRKARMGVGV